LGPRQEEAAPPSALHLISEAVPGSGRSRLVGATARGDGATIVRYRPMASFPVGSTGV
jgi:hypothetical protein